MRRLAAVSALAFLIATGTAADPTPKTLTLRVGDLTREALVFAPVKGDGPAPVVFAFHGHGGTAKNSAKTFNYQKHWPEAIVVYMQGVPTPGALTDPEGKRNGWQHKPGDHGDRDLKFFDAVLAKLKADYKVDEKRIYSTGHSNGGGFTYLLWAARGDVFAAVAPSAAGGVARWPLDRFKPKPVLHVAGENDPLVTFAMQKRTMDTVKKINGCEAGGKPWGTGGTMYASPAGAPLVTLIHPGNHKFLDTAPVQIVRFFQEHVGK
jgi:polyhydroxybutyrate depolymerase